MLVEESVTAGIVEPGRTAPGWWDAFADEALGFGRSVGEANGVVGRKTMFSHERYPSFITSILNFRIRYVPFVVLADSNMVGSFVEAITVAG